MTEKEFDKDRIERYYNNNYSESEEDYISKIFNSKECEDKLNSQLLKQFYQIMSENISDQKNLDHILYKVHYKINTNSSAGVKTSLRRTIINWTLKIAGVLFLALSVFAGIGYFNISKNEKLTWVEIKAPAWSRVQFSLPDGTKGWLNSNSTLKYNAGFFFDREVILDGEALFEVVKSQNRFFKVKTNEVTVTALGTRFNVASYNNEKNIEVVLEEGRLCFETSEKKEFHTMNPDDLLVYNKLNRDINIDEVQPAKYMAWTDGKLIFRNDPIDVIGRRLARWYNIEVEIKGKFNDDLRLRATFKDESLEEVLGLLERSLQVKFMILKRTPVKDDSFAKTKVIITPKN